MTIEVMPLGTQTFTTYECDDFEFRANQVTNWLRIKKAGKEVVHINRVAVFKTSSKQIEKGRDSRTETTTEDGRNANSD